MANGQNGHVSRSSNSASASSFSCLILCRADIVVCGRYKWYSASGKTDAQPSTDMQGKICTTQMSDQVVHKVSRGPTNFLMPTCKEHGAFVQAIPSISYNSCKPSSFLVRTWLFAFAVAHSLQKLQPFEQDTEARNVSLTRQMTVQRSTLTQLGQGSLSETATAFKECATGDLFFQPLLLFSSCRLLDIFSS